ncbi:unnamed protein product [Lepeophtheirus salmonis]|uniref:(salmon louse) hypothetical protein n=1 Tax=Lepeophtheirus salmonis TaxID=72036 RepID=A0A7R8CQZ7_LEPSM|nr:unnamed protein product [Lepeophtheirus salmonis]CAF2900459.1 unnamed protein product [Lepeophtheirus salmonis]
MKILLVKEDKTAFQAAYDEATAGEHAKLAPVANSYLADSKDVAEAKKEFMSLYKNAEAVSKSAERPFVPIAYPYYSVGPSFKGFAYSSMSPSHAPLYYSVAPFAVPTVNRYFHYPSPYKTYYTFPYGNSFVQPMKRVEEPAVQEE